MLGLPLPTEEDVSRMARMAATLDQISIALERIATQLERINAAQANTVDPVQMEALRSQLAAHTAALKQAEDNAATP